MLNLESLKPVLDAVEEVFNHHEVDFYLIGAIARDTWYATGNYRGPGTKDVDFVIFAGNNEEFDAIKTRLEQLHGFRDRKDNAFTMVSPAGIHVDILPFGNIADTTEMKVTGALLTSIRIDGFREVFDRGTTTQRLATGHQFQVATLPAIVLLKLIAYDDRPENRLKDSTDIAGILINYFDLQGDFIFAKHADIWSTEETMDLEEVSALVIGREIRAIVDHNNELCQRLVRILAQHIEKGEQGAFVKAMVATSKSTVLTIERWLQWMLAGLEGK